MSSTTPDAPPPPDKISQLLSDLQGKYKKPDPENLFMKATRFEQIFNRLVAPFIGANAFLLGGIILHGLYPQEGVLISACNLAAALVIISLVFFYSKKHDQAPPMMISIAMASILAAVFNMPISVVALGLAIIIAYAFAGFVYLGKFDQKATILYGLYLPILVYYLGPRQSLQRLVLDALIIIPTLIMFIHGKLRQATFAMILSAVLTAIIEGDSIGSTSLLTVILFIFVILSIYYEIRIPQTGYSNFRTFFDQSMFLPLTYILFLSFGSGSAALRWWMWAALVVVYQGLQYLREKAQSHTRLALAGIAITMAFWVTLPKDLSPLALSYLVAVAGTMLFAALLHLAALYVESAFLSNVAILLIIPGAAWIAHQSHESFFLLLVFMGPLTAIELSLMSRRPVFPVQVPWWSGFLRQDHMEWVKNATLTIIGPILTAPFISFFVNLFRTAFLWLRYFKGEENPFGLMDILFALANIYGAFILTNQVSIIWHFYPASDPNRAFVAVLVWALWGLGIFFFGLRQSCIYYRLLGTCIIILPWICYRKGIIYQSQEALMALITGAALLLVGLLLLTIYNNDRDTQADKA